MDHHQQIPNSNCSACGTSPMSHTMLLIGDFFGTYGIAPFQKVSSALFRFRFINWLGDRIMRGLANVLSFLRILFFSKNSKLAVSGRSQLIWQEALRRGIEMQQVIFLKKPIELYRARIGGTWEYFESLPIPRHLARDNYEARLDDKFLLAEDLRKAGIPVPVARTVGSFGAAQRAFDSLTKPVIIKPRSGSRGRHTTTHIKTEDELRAAYDLCRKIAARMVIEEHFFGSVYRGTVIGGKLVGFFKADPPQVTGDGKSTIAQLVELKNKKRPDTLGDIKLNEDAVSFLARLGLATGSVLAKGQTVDLSAKTGRFYGGYTREMLAEVHPDFANYFEKAAEVAGAPVVGFDAIIEDPTKHPTKQRWGIIEGNSLPFIDLHYYAYENGGLDLAPLVWDLWD